MKGMKMAGRMGSNWRQLMGLRIWRINTKYNILYIQGPVIPGPTHCYVRISDSCLPKNKVNIQADNHAPFPTFYPEDQEEKLAEDLFFNEIHKFSEPTIKFEDFEFKQVVKRDGAKLAKIKTK
jgi:large subunit ribosomal protein L3